MSHYKPYSAYKDSGVAWLGIVPEIWTVKKLKWLASLQSGDFITSESIEVEGEYPVYGGNGLRGYTRDFTHEGRYALVGRQGALCGNINYSDGQFWASEHAVVVSPREPIHITWLGELLRCMNLNQYSVSAAQPGLAVERVTDLYIPVPSLFEQAEISGFLDRETARIDTLVTKKTRFIELLREKRQALITHAVTKGLDPNVKMKDSGAEWLGEVPEHWEVTPVKYFATHIGSGKTPSGGAEVYQDSGVLFLRSQNVHDDGLRLDEVAYISADIDHEMKGSRVHENDVLLNITGASIGRSCIAPINIPAANVNQHVCIVRMCDAYLASWISVCFVSNLIQAQIDFSQNGAGREGLNFEQIGNMVVVIPPAYDRRLIKATIDRETIRIDSLIRKTERSIELLKERRSALITAAVTGQIDLRETA